MEVLLRLLCDECNKAFIVNDTDVEGEVIACPHCQADVPVPDEDEE